MKKDFENMMQLYPKWWMNLKNLKLDFWKVISFFKWIKNKIEDIIHPWLWSLNVLYNNLYLNSREEQNTFGAFIEFKMKLTLNIPWLWSLVYSLS